MRSLGKPVGGHLKLNMQALGWIKLVGNLVKTHHLVVQTFGNTSRCNLITLSAAASLSAAGSESPRHQQLKASNREFLQPISV